MKNKELQVKLAELPNDAEVGIFRFMGQFASSLKFQPVSGVGLGDYGPRIGLEFGAGEVIKADV